MFSKKSKNLTASEIINFSLPRLHKGREWFVDFFSIDPVSGRMKRKKYMLGRYKNYNERMDAASLLITNLTIKLREGWSPYVDSMRSRGFMKIEKIIEDYLLVYLYGKQRHPAVSVVDPEMLRIKPGDHAVILYSGHDPQRYGDVFVAGVFCSAEYASCLQ